MIFASDLDQTLIYSKNFLKNNYQNRSKVVDNVSIIEYLNGEPLSYINNELVPLLQMLDDKNCFVPVTTRTEEQYKRIEFSRFNINPEYAITTNGAKILKDGKVDKEWEDNIRERMVSIEHNANDICQLIEDSISSNAVKTIRTAEDIFSYCVLHKEKLDYREVEELSNKLDSDDWIISLQGRKLYFMPSVINKWEATEYVCSKLGSDKVIGAGDSLLDLPLLDNADIGLVPSHGEIFKNNLHTEYDLDACKSIGIHASTEIVEIAKDKIFGNEERYLFNVSP